MEQTIVQRIAFKGVIVNANNEVLLLREAATYADGSKVGRYGLPGGRLNPGEAWHQGLDREILEETGLTVDILYPLHVGEWRPVIKSVPHQIVAVFMVCRLKSSQPVVLSDEHDKFEWVNATSWINLAVMEPDDQVLIDFFEPGS